MPRGQFAYKQLPLIRSQRATSGYYCVRRKRGRWFARIFIYENRSYVSLGGFSTPEDAAREVSRALFTRYGETALHWKPRAHPPVRTCRWGHLMTKENTRVRFHKKLNRCWTECRKCVREDELARYHRKKRQQQKETVAL